LTAAWTAALDQLEAQLDGVEVALDAGARVVVSGVPSGLGQLPPELVPRAMTLQHRFQELEAILQLEVEHARRSMVLTDAVTDGDSTPRFFDHKA
jgi:hypothetical protein